jgi:hypothetical protein
MLFYYVASCYINKLILINILECITIVLRSRFENKLVITEWHINASGDCLLKTQDNAK